MARDLPHDDAQHEDNLLVEAMSLLVQRQRETEVWIAEQIDQAEERAASVERRYAELELRLAGLEEHLDRVTRDFEGTQGDSAVGQRLAKLREQVADLKAESVESRPLAHIARPAEADPVRGRAEPVAPARPAEPVAPARPSELLAPARSAELVAPARPAELVAPARSAEPAAPARPAEPAAQPSATSEPRGRPTVWDLVGHTPRDRVGLLAIFVGLVAVLYAGLSQLRF